ncbi:hypothetical protein ACFL6M_01205 [Candidatus Eisenbacteria bacterium]|uniref:DUF1304 domain-containing protein n=1 Tax=Eiseniibacteriota bacterium TaxID=2212470 RepID=A0ABV6YJ82_UNCEI
MNPSLLMTISAGIVGLLGLVHLVLTFFGAKHLPKDRSLVDAMAKIAPEITARTTIWKMWMGFNAGHSVGLLLFGLIYGYLALAHGELLFQSSFFQVLGLGTLASYVVLARRYWFIAPLAGLGLSLILYVTSIALAWAA